MEWLNCTVEEEEEEERVVANTGTFWGERKAIKEQSPEPIVRVSHTCVLLKILIVREKNISYSEGSST